MSNRFRKTTNPELLHVATLGKTVGLKGELKLHLQTDFPEQFKTGSRFSLENGKEIVLVKYNSERGLVQIEGINTPEDAKALTNARLFTTKEATREMCNLTDGEFFWFDVIGLKVIENGMELGVVEEIERIGSQDYLLVKTAESLTAKGYVQNFLIPYIDHFIIQTDTDSRLITVNGGLDLLEAS